MLCARGLLRARPPLANTLPRHYTAAPNSTPLRNDNIPYKVVRVVDNETKKPGPPIPLKDVLALLRHPSDIKPKKTVTTHYVEVVRQPSEDMDGFALVKLFDIKAQTARQRQQREHQRATRKLTEQKEVQLTWHIAGGDLEHKLRKVREEIASGYRVDLVFAPKSGQQPLTPQKMDAKATEAVQALQDVAREWRERDKRRKNVCVVYLQDLHRPLPASSAKAMKQAASVTIPDA
ncbi:hypothetical protein FA95DRAFT_1601674 [Auriscalpium vulgare]|uniref:Uncharacterized protein n=1 Tax=Auriscalpium vulgare TaxID=40419 RepID=A0ACB8S9R6_9AGAM|nr:hypothetical protein FA95DRAFT_1601674 [Auriscalpium vulgare]